jgi:hypothetical protein
MPSLHEVQRRFYAAVMAPEASGDAFRATLAPGIEVYRNNAREGFRKALAADYPVIEQLVGDAYFAYLSWTYARQCPSRSGDLQVFCTGFPPFLTRHFRGTGFEYMADVAAIEQAQMAVLIAQEATPVEAASLASDAGDVTQLTFNAHPAVRLLGSPYPALRIWQAHQAGSDPAPIDLRGGPQFVVIRRRQGQVLLHEIADSTYRFLREIFAGTTLGAAAGVAIESDPEFVVTTEVQRLFAWQLVTHRIHSIDGERHHVPANLS